MSTSSPIIVDTRAAGDRSCADVTTEAFLALSKGSDFELVSDHDPTPLKYLLTAEHPGQATWTPIETGPEVWRVQVGKEVG